MYKVKNIPVEKIRVGEHDTRIDVTEESLTDLVESINRIGLVCPLSVCVINDNYMLLAGHRRLAACKKLGYKEVQCCVYEEGQTVGAELAFAENFFREDLTPVELACAIKDVYVNKVMTVEQIARSFHRTEHWVKCQLAICDWPADILEALHGKKISVAAAVPLAEVTDETYRNFLVRQACEAGASARTTSAWLQGWRSMMPPELAVKQEPAAGYMPIASGVPQAPCFCCAAVRPMNELSHVPICSGCITAIRQVGAG